MATISTSVTVVELKRSLVPARWESSVRTVGMAEYKEAALSLAHAFAADDLSQYLVVDSDDAAASPGLGPGLGPEAEEQWRLHVDIMTYLVAAVALRGLVTTIGSDYEGVALWMPPGKSVDDWWTVLRSGMWRLYFQLSAEGRRRYYGELLPLLHHTKLEVLGDRDADSYYLLYLGTKPGARRRGYARKLLEGVFERADAEGRPVYLESSSLANNAYYKRFGFELKRTIALARGPAPVCLWIMVREPQPQAQAQAQAVVRKGVVSSPGGGGTATSCVPGSTTTTTATAVSVVSGAVVKMQVQQQQAGRKM